MTRPGGAETRKKKLKHRELPRTNFTQSSGEENSQLLIRPSYPMLNLTKKKKKGWWERGQRR